VTALLVVVLVLVTLLAVASYLLGFRLGGAHWQQELMRVRLEASQASRQMHELTRQAFTAMAEEADRQRRQ
jgi:hypothetical protein